MDSKQKIRYRAELARPRWKEVLELLNDPNPHNHPRTRALMQAGVPEKCACEQALVDSLSDLKEDVCGALDLAEQDLDECLNNC